MFSAANDTIPLFRPRRGRDDRDASAGLMRNPNQINNARRREANAQDKRRVDGEAGHTQRRKANALAPRGGRRGMYAHLTRGQRARLTRRRARQQEHLARERGAARSCM